MAEPKDKESFFRKVVRFVANPATDWNELNSRQFESSDAELERSELKAMIERKRRNDFVRKREFDMLRKVRREGLTAEQLAALGWSSRIDDSEVRADSAGPRPDGVKEKIDEIEQQMVSEGFQTTSRRASGFHNATTMPAVLGRGMAPPAGSPGMLVDDADELPALPPLPDTEHAPPPRPAASPSVVAAGLPPLVSQTPPRAAEARAPLAPLPLPGSLGDDGLGFNVEVSEVEHDPELDEAVISFANADFEQCESSLTRLTRTGGERFQHAETWLVLFDLYRATGQQEQFEALAVEYAEQFGWSAPQWFSLPKLVADAAARPARSAGRSTEPSAGGGDVGWLAPERLDVEAVSQLRSQTLQMPLPWVLDWAPLRHIDAEAATQLSALCRVWAGQALEMRWLGGERLFAALQEAAPTGVRDADPAFWLARLDALRLANRADQFDEAAIDYCVTYEVSPPSWEPTRCKVRVGSSNMSTRNPPLSMVSEVSTSFLESGLHEEPAMQQARLELSGQLVGDIGPVLERLNGQLGESMLVSVSCARLIRVDFPAAGDLLNWVLARSKEKRQVQFVEAHRLVALFFGAMGINEHAQVLVRKV